MNDFRFDLTVREKNRKNTDARKNVLDHVKGADEKTIRTILKKYGL